MGLHGAVASKVEDAQKHGLLQLSHYRLSLYPRELLVVSTELSVSLLRLDLSFNLLETVPEAISALVALQVLYLNHNPRLALLPASLTKCVKLQVLDVSCTALNALPCEYGRLERLKVLAIDATPLEKRWLKKKHLTRVPDDDEDNNSGESRVIAVAAAQTPTVTQCQQILKKLRRKDERVQLKRQLFEKLHDKVYRIERVDTCAADAVHIMLQRVLKHFPLAEELHSLIRNAERLFPSVFTVTSMEKLDAVALRAAYEALRDENERKKRAADLEIKIRNLYFDRIDPTRVEKMVASIYEHVHALADVKFLVKHAAQLFPQDAKDVDGREIYSKLVALQQEIARERAAAVDKLLAAVKGVYSDTEPDQVQLLVAKVATLFKVKYTNIGISVEDELSIASFMLTHCVP